MKKTLLSAAAFAVVAVSAVAVAPTTSEAIPAFARQTGAACLSCHFQTFPALTAFGRSFKYGAFTDVGEQALVEDENLSIPASLNATIVVRPQFASTKTSANAALQAAAAVTTLAAAQGFVAPAGVVAGSASWTSKTASLTADNVVLIAGRIGSNTGAFAELGGGAFGNIQLLNSYDMGGFKLGWSIYNTGFGSTAGLEVSNVDGQHAGGLNMRQITASNQIDVLNGLSYAGASLWVANEMGFGSFSMLTSSAAVGGAGVAGPANGWKLAPQARLFFTPEVGGMDAGIGVTVISGKTGDAQTVAALGLAAGTSVEIKKTAVDAQLQGEIGETSFGIYADYATANGSSATKVNLANKTTGKFSGWSLRGTVKPLHNLILGVGYGSSKLTDGTVALSGFKRTILNVAAEYEIYQNFVAALSYTTDKTKFNATALGSGKVDTLLLDIEALM